MNRLFLLCLALGLANSAIGADKVKLQEGTEVELVFLEQLSSATAVAGQRFNLEVDQAVKAGGRTVIPAGAKAVGTVVNARKRGFMGKAGQLDVQINYVVVGEERIRLRASSGKEGEGRVGATVALTVLFGPLGLLKRGKDIEVPPGAPMTAYIDAMTEIELPDAAR